MGYLKSSNAQSEYAEHNTNDEVGEEGDDKPDDAGDNCISGCFDFGFVSAWKYPFDTAPDNHDKSDNNRYDENGDYEVAYYLTKVISVKIAKSVKLWIRSAGINICLSRGLGG